MRTGQVLSLSAEAIQDVHAPPSAARAAIHVYRGPRFDQPRFMCGIPTRQRSTVQPAVTASSASDTPTGYLVESS